MHLLLYPLILLSSFPLYQAVNLCPGYAPDPELDGACIGSNFDGVLNQYNATIEAIHRVNETLPCYGEDTYDNIFYNSIFGNCSFTDSARRFDGSCNYALLLPPSCAMIVKKDTYRFGLIMPKADSYNGSFMATGGFSYAGGINWREMWAGAFYYGMAVMSTDQGHRSNQTDMSWARNNDTARKDWGYRALDGSVPVAKSLINRYYGADARHSYFAGCSTSGRQGLKQLEVDQSAFDGLLIGAPAWDQEHMLPWITKLAVIDPPNSTGNIPVDFNQAIFITEGIRNGCDGKDGAADGVIMDPAVCDIREVANANLRCRTATNSRYCLNDTQIDTLVAVHQNYTVTENNGNSRTVFPGPEPGAEYNLFTAYLGAEQRTPRTGFDWQWEIDFLDYPDNYTYNDQIVIDAENRRPGNASPRANETDWAAFNTRGGKVIMYHGLVDGIVPTDSSLDYFNQVGEASAQRDDFMLYYRVPGMAHCFLSDSYIVNVNISGVPPQLLQFRAPWFFSGATQGSTAYGNNVSTDIFAALVNWVEKPDQKPKDIIATTWNATTAAQTIFAQRPICPFPKTAHYIEGVSNDTTSWNCSLPLA
ncbi:ferulic acid Esterase/Feruloyl esterase [Apiospora rasikravindrae]|uniref:Carboxylic ester hydrolase n=1 Tax=Apiospora rasikravindrae TaxID=990691 RepID=A0ABR1TFP3_9PEZI